MKNKLSQKLEQRQKLSPSQILTSKLLHLNQISLEQRIIRELEQNPALELEDLLPPEEEETENENDEVIDEAEEVDDEIDFDVEDGED